MPNRLTATLIAGTLAVAGLLSHHLTSATAQDEIERQRKHPTVVTQINDDVSVFMQEKLKACDQVLQGIANEDHKQIAGAANKLMAMSKRALWRQRATAVYTQDTVDFVANVTLLRKMADADNLPGATLAYSQLIVRCADCHGHVRIPKVAQLDDPLGGVDAIVAR